MFRRNSEMAERFRILFLTLQAVVVTQMYWIDFIHIGTIIELRRGRKNNELYEKASGQGLFRHNSKRCNI